MIGGRQSTEVKNPVAAGARHQWRRAKNEIIALEPVHYSRGGDHDAVHKAVLDLMARCTAAAPKVRRVLGYLSMQHHGKLVGLEWEIKGEASLHRKLMVKVTQDATAAAKEGRVPKTAQQVADSIHDVLRYTSLFPTVEYVASVAAVLGSPKVKCPLEAEGFEMINAKNYWGPGDDYQGINTSWFHPDLNIAFEAQFHTPESFKTKEETCHVAYNVYRVSNSPDEKRVLWKQMIKFWDDVPVPPHVLDIQRCQLVEHKQGSMAPSQNKIPLTMEQRMKEQRRVHLEELCTPVLKQMHMQAVDAQKELSTMMAHLAVKHQATQRESSRSLRGLDQIVHHTVVLIETREDAGTPIVHNNASIAELCWRHEAERPILKFVFVVSRDTYTSTVTRVIHELESMEDYGLLSVMNWWRELEDSDAINIKVEAERHGIHFELLFHTSESYDLHLAMLHHHSNDVRYTHGVDKDHEDTQQRQIISREWKTAWCNCKVPHGCLSLGTRRSLGEPEPTAAVCRADVLNITGGGFVVQYRSLTFQIRLFMAANLCVMLFMVLDGILLLARTPDCSEDS